MRQEVQANGHEIVHLLFGLHKNHQEDVDKLFYIYFDLGNDKVHAPTGEVLGLSVTRTEFEDEQNKALVYSDPPDPEPYPHAPGGIVGVDTFEQPNIFYSTRENGGKRTINWVMWEGDKWSEPAKLFWNANHNGKPIDTDVYEVEFHDDGTFDLYVRQVYTDRRDVQNDCGQVASYECEPQNTFVKLSRWNYDAARAIDGKLQKWEEVAIRSQKAPGKLRYGGFAFVVDGHADLRATFQENHYFDWKYPKADGVLYGFGDRGVLRLEG